MAILNSSKSIVPLLSLSHVAIISSKVRPFTLSTPLSSKSERSSALSIYPFPSLSSSLNILIRFLGVKSSYWDRDEARNYV